ncbi:MAG TPA: AMP phosphorylase [Candidatus Thermoplasmatota archaeon]|nr:AMP phosphorylase [Candidatus Thermoplasmatota archaeon]
MEGLKLRAKLFEMELGKLQVLIHARDAESLGVHPGDRVRVQNGHEPKNALVEVTQSAIQPGEIGVFTELTTRFKLEGGETLTLYPAEKPESVGIIKKKMHNKKLSKEEIDRLVFDVVDGTLSDIELAAWVTSLEINDMDMEEVEHLTRAMVNYGEVLDFGNEVVFDKHSIGGVPGNKITLLVVPIVASQGLLIPKTSSRAVTGAAGTADVMEVFGPVNLDAEQIRRITLEHGGVMCWGGGVNLAPADDIIIRAENPLTIDPPAQLLASVMAKKKAVGANKLVMDLPMGEGTKLPTLEDARKMARSFIELGERLDMQVECAVTYGGQPVGKTVGCALEANEALAALRGLETAPRSLIEKSCSIAGIALEMGGVVGRGKGKQRAEEILKSGEALQKFEEIVRAQGGEVPKGDVPVGKYHESLVAADGGYVSGIKNKAIVQIARISGSPREHGAGVFIHHKRGDKVDAGEPLLTVYAESEFKLKQAVAFARKVAPVNLEGMLLQRIPDFRQL